MSVQYPTLGDIWPYSEAAVAPELAPLPVDFFFSDPKDSRITAASWTTPADPEAAPQASYALRLRCKGRQGDIARWNPLQGEWKVTRTFPVPPGEDSCSIIDLKGILLGGVETTEALATRMKSLLQAELSRAKKLRCSTSSLSR